MKKDKEKEKFKKLEDGEKPFLGAFVGEERHFGLPNKTFRVYLEGEGDDGDKTFVPVQMITPKARKLTKFVIKASNLRGIADGDFSEMDDNVLDDFIDLTQELFQIPDVTMDKLTFMALLNLISFATKIAVNPSN